MMRLLPLIMALALPAAAVPAPVCHIHPPPSETDASTPAIVGPYGSIEACERANAALYSGRGRCHCAFDGAGWQDRPRLPELPQDPGQDPYSGRNN
jgi:hypothetical protein